MQKKINVLFHIFLKKKFYTFLIDFDFIYIYFVCRLFLKLRLPAPIILEQNSLFLGPNHFILFSFLFLFTGGQADQKEPDKDTETHTCVSTRAKTASPPNVAI